MCSIDFFLPPLINTTDWSDESIPRLYACIFFSTQALFHGVFLVLGCELCSTLLRCRDLFSVTHKAPSLPPSEPSLLWWSSCHSNPLASQPYLEQGGGEGCIIRLVTLSELKTGCIQDIRTFLLILQERNREGFLRQSPSQLPLRKTLNALLSCRHPDHTTWKQYGPIHSQWDKGPVAHFQHCRENNHVSALACR